MSFILSSQRVANTGQDFNALDTAGKAWWVEQIDAQGQDIVHVAEQFMHSAELMGQYLAPEQWDFLL